MKKVISLALLSLLIYSCANPSHENWTSIIPKESSFIIVPQKSATIDSVLQSDYVPTLEDISSSAIQLMAEVDSTADKKMTVESIVLYPGAHQRLQPIWILGAANGVNKKLKEAYGRDFRRNKYQFLDHTILRFSIKNHFLFVTRIRDLLFVSESSWGLENVIRTYIGQRQPADISEIDIQAGSLIMNTPALDQWLSQIARVSYHPVISNVFEGTSPALLTVQTRGKDANRQVQFKGDIALTGDSKSTLLSAISHQNGNITLDQYISSDAAAFGIFHVPKPQPMSTTLPDTSALDQAFIDNPDILANLASPLGSELALVMFAESGFLSTGEYVFIRKMEDVEDFRKQLEALSQRNLIGKTDGLYFVESYGLADQLSSGMTGFNSFYIKITGKGVIMSERKGLAELVASDRKRRRVVVYEPYYEKMKSDFPEQLSSLFVAGPKFFASKKSSSTAFLTPYLSTKNYLTALTSGFNYASLTTRVNDSKNTISLNFSTFNKDNGNRPFQENWLSNSGSAELSGQPTFGNIGGSSNAEVVFATQTGSVYALAASDGTVVQQYNTGSDKPIGSPVIYDWYGTGQNMILLAAGNKIYGWDEKGKPLPNFPIEMRERITTPLTVTDIDNDRTPDLVLGTANRKLHILNRRGINLPGWPVSLNTPATSRPFVDYFQGGPAVVVFASNAIHAWDAAGNSLPNFPVFVNANLRGSPALFNKMILGNGVDGKLYAVGDEVSFSDSLNVFHSTASGANAEAIRISNGALTGTPHTYENNILTTAQNGSVFLLNANGELQMTKSMGQPSAQSWSSVITDINSDGQQDIVALAEYGRLYAWQLSNGERIHSLPTAGMNYLNIGDLDGDGLKEIVAQTKDGVRCWTINRE